ncbi:TPA: hypothetical protein R4Y39_000479 [Raoultella planticola]|nr:hypothetical protein [Raoultella planticola]
MDMVLLVVIVAALAVCRYWPFKKSPDTVQKASSGAFDRVALVDDVNHEVINYQGGESPYAEGRKQLQWNLHDSLGPQVIVADQRLTERHSAPHPHLSPR